MSLADLQKWIAEAPPNAPRTVRLSAGRCDLGQYPYCYDIAVGYGETLDIAVTQALTVAASWQASREGL